MNINGRIVIDRAGIAEFTGAALSTVDKWYSNRQRYGFPSRADGVHGAWWYLDDIENFWDHYQQAHRAALDRVTAQETPTNLSAHRKPPVFSATTLPLTYLQRCSTSPTTSRRCLLADYAAHGNGAPSGPGQITTSAITVPEDPQALKDHAEPATTTATPTNSSTPPKQHAFSDTPTEKIYPPTYSTTQTTPNT